MTTAGRRPSEAFVGVAPCAQVSICVMPATGAVPTVSSPPATPHLRQCRGSARTNINCSDTACLRMELERDPPGRHQLGYPFLIVGLAVVVVLLVPELRMVSYTSLSRGRRNTEFLWCLLVPAPLVPFLGTQACPPLPALRRWGSTRHCLVLRLPRKRQHRHEPQARTCSVPPTSTSARRLPEIPHPVSTRSLRHTRRRVAPSHPVLATLSFLHPQLRPLQRHCLIMVDMQGPCSSV